MCQVYFYVLLWCVLSHISEILRFPHVDICVGTDREFYSRLIADNPQRCLPLSREEVKIQCKQAMLFNRLLQAARKKRYAE